MMILVCGDRLWKDVGTIRAYINTLNPRDIVICGGARGADMIAAQEAHFFGLQTRILPAEWGKFGKRAGPIRNRAMLDLKPDLVVAFHNNLEQSKGTKDCVEEALKRGIDVKVIKGL